MLVGENMETNCENLGTKICRSASDDLDGTDRLDFFFFIRKVTLLNASLSQHYVINK